MLSLQHPYYVLISGLLLFGINGFAVADKFDDAERAANEFTQKYDQIRNLNVSELRRLVNAVCDAEEAERRSISRSSADRVESEVRRSYEGLRDQRARSLTLIRAVLDDQKFKGKHSRAKEYESRINEFWERIERVRSNGVLGGNNPVVAFMLRAGQEAHSAYQNNSSNCAISEWPISNGRADCIKRSSCEVIEVKPNNSRSISQGRSQSRAYAEVLNQSPDEFRKLIDRDRSFQECKGKFRPRVACYHICPDINDDGTYRSTSVGWTFCD